MASASVLALKASRARTIGRHLASPTAIAIAQVAEEVTAVVPFPSGPSPSILPIIKARAILAPTVKALPTFGVANARAFRVVIKVTKDVVVDGSRLPVP